MFAFVVEVLVILSTAIVFGAIYHSIVYGNVGPVNNHLAIGAITALAYTLPFLYREEYTADAYLEGRRNFNRTFVVWNMAILSLAAIGFLTKTTDGFSRGAFILFYAGGFVAVAALSSVTRTTLISMIRLGRIDQRRIMLVGSENDIRRMEGEIATRPNVIRVVAAQMLPFNERERGDPGTDTIAGTLAAAVEKARLIGVDDVVILVDWSRTELIEQIVSAFMAMPVAIHLGASSVLGRFEAARVSRFDTLTALSLTAAPLGPVQIACKRAVDFILAFLVLLLCAPLFAAIAIAIKSTSTGPVFFRQRRRGFNSREFRIWKFRTMTTQDDGDVVIQAQVNDKRVTRVGSFLRRWNLDELPQVLNVLRGEMSLVGPRPHAVAHDKIYETIISSYARRLNVKPGITGWAQVNGFRGATDTEDSMRARVDHDLYYIDHWSILLDLYILALTVVSPKAYRNAH